jgi:hypothetical protein
MAQHSNPGVVPLGARPLPVFSPVSSPCNSDHDGAIGNGNGISVNGNGNEADANIDIDVDINADIEIDANADGRSLLSSPGNRSGLTLGTGGMKRRRGRGIRRCRKCQNNYKPPRAHHDSVTGRCIVKFDHFCPWVGNAVGALNHKFFFLFILYTCMTSLISILLLMIRFVRCGFMVEMENQNTDSTMDKESIDIDTNNTLYNNTDVRFLFSRYLDDNTTITDNDDDNTTDMTFKFDGCESAYTVPVIILLIVSIIFLSFTCCMLFEQLDAIETNQSKIARLKMKMGHSDAHEYARVGQDFNEFFGGDSLDVALHWFLPLPIQFPVGKRDRVMGFEYNDAWCGKIYDDMENDIDEEEGVFLNDGREREVELSDVSVHSHRKSSSLILKDEDVSDVELELPSGNDGATKKGRALKKRSTGGSKLGKDSSESSLKIV